MSAYEYEIAVVGGGSAGYAAARTTAAAGLRTVVIEGGPEVGGLCILRGCMPTKALLYASEVRHLARNAAPWGLQVPEVGFDFRRVMERKAALIREFADHRRAQLEDGRFDFIRSRAEFVDPHTVQLSGGRRLTAAGFVLATGSVVKEPPLPALRAAGYLTSDDALSLAELPKSLIVLGGGPIAAEFAQFFSRFDVPVTLVQRSPHILREYDADAAAVLEEVFRREGIRLHTGTRLLDAGRGGGTKWVEFEESGRRMRAEAGEILFALGRRPNTAGLGLERAGVEVREEDERILTDDSLRTSAPHIYAAGDCTSPHEIVHLAVLQGEIAGRNLVDNRRNERIDYRLLLDVVFTEPQVATVGWTEKAAAALGVRVLVARYPFADHGKSMIMEARDGFVKLLADSATGEIVGGACVGPVAGELIHEIAVAMAGRMTVGGFAAIPHYHPTLAEIWTYPAEELAGRLGR